jgi:hypothetical protein
MAPTKASLRKAMRCQKLASLDTHGAKRRIVVQSETAEIRRILKKKLAPKLKQKLKRARKRPRKQGRKKALKQKLKKALARALKKTQKQRLALIFKRDVALFKKRARKDARKWGDVYLLTRTHGQLLRHAKKNRAIRNRLRVRRSLKRFMMRIVERQMKQYSM